MDVYGANVSVWEFEILERQIYDSWYVCLEVWNNPSALAERKLSGTVLMFAISDTRKILLWCTWR